MSLRSRAKTVYNTVLFNASRKWLEKFLQEAAHSVPPGSKVLDAGAGDTRYRKLFTHTRYESADFCQSEIVEYGSIDYVCDLGSIPVEPDRYDLVVCTQVLEHLPDPLKVLCELWRVLKPGGKLWLTAPFIFAEHMQPHDYYRYTQFGLRHLLTQAGFQVERLERLDGYYVTLAYELATAARVLPLAPGSYGGGVVGILMSLLALPMKPGFLAMAAVLSRVEMRHKNTTAAHSKNYAAVARKP